jgi:hypothetical protein
MVGAAWSAMVWVGAAGCSSRLSGPAPGLEGGTGQGGAGGGPETGGTGGSGTGGCAIPDGPARAWIEIPTPPVWCEYARGRRVFTGTTSRRKDPETSGHPVWTTDHA